MSALSRVLVMGGTGMLGHAAVRVLAADFDVMAPVRDPDAAQRHVLPAALVGFDGVKTTSGSCWM